MRQEAPRRAGQSRPCRTLARLAAAQESDEAAAKGRSQLQPRLLKPGSARRSRDVRGEGAHPWLYRVRNSVVESPPPTAALDSQTPPRNETKTPPSDGPPMLLDCSQQPTFVVPQAAICRSSDLQPQIKSSFKMGSLIGRGSGESFQLAFHGPGFVVVQPSEGQPVVASS